MKVYSTRIRSAVPALVSFFIAAHSTQAAEPLRFVRAAVSPDTVIIGEQATVFLHPATNYASPDRVRLLLDAAVDGVPVTALHPSQDMWVLQLGPYLQAGSHDVMVTAFLENADEADELRAGITAHTQVIADLDDEIANETDPARLVQLQEERATKVAERTEMQATLAGLKREIGVDTFTVSVNANTDVNLLRRTLQLGANHHLTLRNNDFGWDFMCPTDNCSSPTNASAPNMFGVHALGLLDAYSITREPAILMTVRGTADVLMTRPVSRTQRLYSGDEMFLIEAQKHFGVAAFRIKAQASFQSMKDHAAAMHILDNPNPTNAAVDAVPQVDIDAVTDAQRVTALTRRLRDHLGRNAGLRGYDWYYRYIVAKALGDEGMARAIADQASADFNLVDINQYYYFSGLSGTIFILSDYVDEVPAFAPVIAAARTALLSHQQPSGRFYVPPTEGMEAGQVQDEALILKALLKTGDVTPMANLLAALYDFQQSWGGYIEYEIYEVVIGEAEMLAALSAVWNSQVGADIWHVMMKRSLVHKRLMKSWNEGSNVSNSMATRLLIPASLTM